MENKIKKTTRTLPKAHKFVTALQQQRSNSKLIRGFIGESKNKSYLRVYLDVELNRFVEIPKKDILHFEDTRDRYGDSTSVVLWVNEKASIQHFGHWFANDDPTTMATGEEGGGDPTTMATGEESTGPFNPFDELINPFGNFR